MGGATDLRYNLSFIVENSVKINRPIIGVSIAYRLSAWGFLQSQEVSGSGNSNMGLRDQRLALHWIQENIGAFGGDCSKVTIWGESRLIRVQTLRLLADLNRLGAGAGSVGWQLLAYNGRDDKLFRAGSKYSIGHNTVNDSSRLVVHFWMKAASMKFEQRISGISSLSMELLLIVQLRSNNAESARSRHKFRRCCLGLDHARRSAEILF
jgi:hypothetical protein